MDRVRLGRTNVEVSVAGLGCGGSSRLGMSRGATSEEAAVIVRAALDLGITFIDTAKGYGTEEAVGIGIKGRREEVFISTKFQPLRRTQDSTSGLTTPADMVASLENSLRQLGVEQIDLFNIHGVHPDNYDEILETLVPALLDQQRAGKFRFLGLTEMFIQDPPHACLQRAVPSGLFDVVMVGLNMLNPSARDRVFPLTKAHDVGTQIMFAVRRALSNQDALVELVKGLADTGEIPTAGLNLDDPLDFVRDHPGVKSIIEASYRYCRHTPGADVILTGTGHVSHLKENVEAILAPPLPDDLIARLDEIFGKVDSVSGN